jgi:hypothetical protein
MRTLRDAMVSAAACVCAHAAAYGSQRGGAALPLLRPAVLRRPRTVVVWSGDGPVLCPQGRNRVT